VRAAQAVAEALRERRQDGEIVFLEILGMTPRHAGKISYDASFCGGGIKIEHMARDCRFAGLFLRNVSQYALRCARVSA
jgi:hypothetical protein